MHNPSEDAELSRLLALTAHEIRNPASPIVGFINFVLRDKKNEISAQQRQWLETAVNSCGRLRDLADQLSEYALMVKGELRLNRTPTDLAVVLREAIAAVPPYSDADVPIEATGETAATVDADRLLVKKALTSIIAAIRREVGMQAKLYVVLENGEYSGKPASWVLVGDEDQLPRLQEAKNDPGWFDDKERGNLGVTVWIAKWIFQAHGGGLWAPASAPKGGGALIALPHA